MAEVFNRMTVRAKDFEIFFYVVFAVSIAMMNSKNFFDFIKTTSVAFFNQSIFFHFFSNNLICWLISFLGVFSNAFFRTKYSFHRKRIVENFVAIFTRILCSSSSYLRFVITLPRAIFCSICSRRNMIEFFIANQAFCMKNYSNVKTLARARTIFKCFKSVFGNIAFFLTVNAFQNFTTKRFHYATS